MELTNKDIEILENLKKISKSIIEYENILGNLECNNLKGSTIYRTILNNLQALLNEENKLYASIKNSHEQIMELIKHLNSNENLYNLPSQMYNLIKNIDHNIIARRIAIRLREIDLNINNEEIDELGKLSIFYANQNKMTNNSKLGILTIDQEIRKDIIHTILALINKEIKNNPNNDYKAFFIKMKYRIASMYKFAEEKLINQNFNIDNQLYWLASSYTYYYRIDNPFYEAYKNEIIATIGTFTTNYFTSLDDSDFENSITIIEAQFYKILLSATLIISPFDLAKTLKELATKIIADKKAYQMNYEGEKMIIETI